MRLPARFRVRTLMLVVALIALAFGIPVEWMNHRRRDRCLQGACRAYERGIWHLRQAANCLRRAGTGPYPRAERLAVIDEYLGAGYSKGAALPGVLTNWSGEAEWHLYWGNRIADQGLGKAENARTFESRLLIP
jgi:hypothetical protein